MRKFLIFLPLILSLSHFSIHDLIFLIGFSFLFGAIL